VLFFDKVSDVQSPGVDRPAVGGDRRRVRVVTMRLGADANELVEYPGRNARPVPADARSNDRSFQHIAIVVNDIDQAYLWLRLIISNRPRRSLSGCRTGIRTPAVSAPSPSRTRTATRSRFSSSPPGRASPLAAAERSVFLGIDHTRWSWAIPREPEAYRDTPASPDRPRKRQGYRARARNA